MEDTPDNPTNSQPAPPEPVAPFETPAPATVPNNPVTGGSMSPRPQRHRIGIFLFVLIILLAAAAVFVYISHSSPNKPKPAAAAKRDIPYLSYELAGADLSQEYPFDSNITENRQVDTQLFEGLVQYKQQTKIIPLLATSWSNPDSSTWIFNLKSGVKFHSGRTMSASDVKYSLDYAVAHQNDNNQSNFTNLASTIKQVDVLNPSKIKITTAGPDPVLLNRLTYLYILDSKGSVADFNDGTGPYTVKPGSKPSTNAIDLTAFDSYHGGHVYTRNVHVQIAANAKQLTTDTHNGKYDLAGNFTNGELATLSNYQLISVQDLGVSVLGLNSLSTTSPFQSLKARQAAAYALDVPTILKAGGLRGTAASQIIPITIAGYDPSIKTIPYNPAKAKELLAAVPNASASATLVYSDDQQTPLLTEIAKELNAVGFNVKLSETDFNTVLDEGLGGQVPMFYATITSNTLDGADIFNSALEGNQIYKNPQVDDLLNQTNTVLDPAKRLQDLQKISKLVATDMPYVPLYTQDRSYVLTKPYVINTDIPSAEVGVYFWQAYQH